MATMESGTFIATINRLFRRGVRYSTVIDVGCADGHFFVDNVDLFKGAVPLNIDASSLYEDSLKSIKDVLGGDYRICAITDYVGNIEVTESVHPYWTSTRPDGDIYWSRVNNLTKNKIDVQATTLDALADELSLKPPFLLKLDVQGAEKSALAGARDLLKDTLVVICETDIDDFQDVNKILWESGFDLYDLTILTRVHDQELGWFYPVYIRRSLDFVRPKSFWHNDLNESVIKAQINRRNAILKSNAEILDRIRNPKSSLPPSTDLTSIGRNQPCPCGSGQKYKHCCGAKGPDAGHGD